MSYDTYSKLLIISLLFIAIILRIMEITYEINNY